MFPGDLRERRRSERGASSRDYLPGHGVETVVGGRPSLQRRIILAGSNGICSWPVAISVFLAMLVSMALACSPRSEEGGGKPTPANQQRVGEMGERAGETVGGMGEDAGEAVDAIQPLTMATDQSLDGDALSVAAVPEIVPHDDGSPMDSTDPDFWYLFLNEEKTLYGFMDKNGDVKIEPKYDVESGGRRYYASKNPFSLLRFLNIVAVSEPRGQPYYLTKDGKKVGKGQVYSNPVGRVFECEKEGFVRFKSKGLVGLMGKDGTIVVPAKYTALSSVSNGMLEASVGGKFLLDRDYPGPFTNSDLFQFAPHNWKGGQPMLLDTQNRVLVKNFRHGSDNLDFRSVLIEDKPSSDPIRDSFLATDGRYYSFINHEKEFKHWLANEFLEDLSKDGLIRSSYKTIRAVEVKKYESVGVTHASAPFVEQHYDLLLLSLNELLEVRNEIVARLTKEDSDFVFEFEREWLLPCKDYEQFCGLCNDYNYGAYPIMMLIHKRLFGDTSDAKHMDYNLRFIRTDAGFRLFEFVWDTVCVGSCRGDD